MNDAYDRSRVASRLLLILAVGLFTAGVAARALIWQGSDRALKSAATVFRVIDDADQVALNLARAEIDRRDRPAFATDVSQMRSQAAALSRLIQGDAAQAERVARANQLAEAEVADLARGAPGANTAQAAGAIGEVVAAERGRVGALSRRFRSQWAQTLGALGLILAGVVAAVWAAVLFLRRMRLSDDALARAARELSAVEIEARRNAAFVEGIGVATPDIVYAKDRNLRFVYANPAAVAALGHPLADILGRRSEDLGFEPAEMEEHNSADREVLETGRTRTVESRLTSPGGAWRVLRSTKFALRDARGAVMGLAALTVDVTEAHAIREALAESESKYRSIANAMPALVWSADANGLRDFYNDRWGQFFGEAGATADGWAWLALTHPEDRARVEAHARRSIAAGQAYEIEYRLMGLQGPCWFLERALPVRNEDGRIHRWEGACVDIEELVENRRAKERALAELAHVSRLSAMGEMASALAHELNQPLSATANYVQGSLRLLAEERIDRATVTEALTMAGEQMFRAGDIIRRLRDFVSKGETERRVESLPKLLEEAGALAMVGAKDRGVRLRYDIDPGVGPVMVDKVQVQQVVLNLMRNGIEAMSETPVRQLTVAAAPAPEDMVRISVRDTGCGLSPEIAGQLFQAFVTTKQHGMGVGLSISRTIVEAHGGRIWAEGGPGKGAAFHFTVRGVHEQEMAYGERV